MTKDDLRQFGLLLENKLRMIIQEAGYVKAVDVAPEWLKSKAARKLLDISAGSVQNLASVSGILPFLWQYSAWGTSRVRRAGSRSAAARLWRYPM